MAKSKSVRDSLESMPMFIYSTSKQRSGNTVERYRSPTNPRTAAAMTQFTFDYSRQAQVFPDSRPDALIESTHKTPESSYKTINRSGETAALGALSRAFIGGVPDEPGFQAKYFGK